MSDVIISKSNSKSIYIGKKSDVITGVSLYAGQDKDGNDIIYNVGDQSGFVLNVDNPFGTEQTAYTILSSLVQRGFQYQAYDANTFLDPSAEIGDSVTVDGEDSIIYSVDVSHSTLMASDVSAPYDEELNHEYEYETKMQRTFEREMAGTKTRLTINEDAIEARVTKDGGDARSFGWHLDADSFTLSSQSRTVMRVDNNGLYVYGEIVATSGNIGGCVIENGVLKVNAANITSISADSITVGTLNVDRIAQNSVPGNRLTNYSIGSTKYGTGSIYGGSNAAIAGGTVSTVNTVSGINTSLGYADFANNVFNGWSTANTVKCNNINIDGTQCGLVSFIDGAGGVRQAIMPLTGGDY